MASRSEGQAILDLLSDRPVAYHPALARLVGSVNAAIFLAQLLYWTGRESSGDGWIWKTWKGWEEETGLTRKEQEGARKKLRGCGVLSEMRGGRDGRISYRVDKIRLLELLQPDAQNAQPDAQFAQGDAQNVASLHHAEITAETTAPEHVAGQETAPCPAVAEALPSDDWQGITNALRPEPRLSRLSPRTPEECALFDALADAALDAGRRPGYRRFATSQQREKYLAAIEVLGDDLPAMIAAALGEGIVEKRRMVDWLAGCARKKRKDNAPLEVGR